MNYKKYFEILGIDIGTDTSYTCDSVMESLESLKSSSYSDKTNAIYQLCEGLNKDRMESLKGESHKNSEDIFNSHSGYFSSKKQEEFHIILFDNQHRVIEMKMVSKGILNKSLVHPRECAV
jgi:DNA repair protein RadC